jgi:endoglucanase
VPNQEIEIQKLAIALNKTLESEGIEWNLVEKIPSAVKPASNDNYSVDPSSNVNYQTFAGAVHLYELKDDKGSSVKEFRYLDKNADQKILKIKDSSEVICVLDFKNMTNAVIELWKIRFASPGLELLKDNLINGKVTKSGEVFTIEPVLANQKIGVGESPRFKLVFKSNRINGVAPILYNFELLNGEKAIAPTPVTSQSAIATIKSKFDLKEVLSKTLYGMTWQSQGKKPEWNKNPHRGDSFMADGLKDANRDLTGGFGDAGDAIKPNYAGAINACMFTWSQLFYPKAYSNDDSDLSLNIIKHYNDYFIRCHELDASGNTAKYWHWVSDNKTDHAIGLNYETQDAEYQKKGQYRKAFALSPSGEKGTEPCAASAASLAWASILMTVRDPVASKLYLKHAIALYNFADTYKQTYTERYVYKSSSGFYDELCLAAIALHMATGDNSYLAKAEEYYTTKLGGYSWTWMVDNQSTICTTMLAYLTKKDYYVSKVKSLANEWLNGKNGVRSHANGSPLRSNADWGTIPQSATAFGQLIFAHDFIPGCQNQAVVDHALKIMDYALGDNKKNLSFLAGFGANFPRHIHHRNLYRNGDASKPNLVGDGLWVAGEKVGGIDTYLDSYNDWVTNEAGCYNASVSMLVSSLANKT